MGTRHLVKIVLNGETKVAQFGHSDGYLEGTGYKLASFIENEYKPTVLKRNVAKLSFYTDEEVDAIYATLKDSEVSEKHPELDSSNPVNVLRAILKGAVKVPDARDFEHDSLFCEWVYTINLDKKEITVENKGYFSKTFKIKDFTIDNLKLAKQEMLDAG